MPLLQLPTEVLTEIFGCLGDDHQALGASALVCRRLQPTCQKALFFQITLDLPGLVEGAKFYKNEANRRADRFLFLILASPHLALYVIRLNIDLISRSGSWVTLLPNFVNILRKLTCLRDLCIQRDADLPRLSWNVFPHLLQTTIIKTIQDRSLSRIYLGNIGNVPAVTFLKSSIQRLSLSSVCWEDPLGSNTAPIESPSLKSLHVTFRDPRDTLSAIDGLLSNGSPFNISELQSMRITIRLNIRQVHRNQISKFRKLLSRAAGTLKHLWVYCNLEADLLDLVSQPYPLIRTIGRRFSIWFPFSGSAQPDPVPFLLRMIPNGGFATTGVEFHLILEIIIYMADPWALNEDLGAWAELAQALTPIPCRLTISIWSHYEFRIPGLIQI